MNYRKKYLRIKEESKAKSRTEKKIKPEEQSDKSYFQNLYENSIKTPKAWNKNLASSDVNSPSFKTRIRDIISTEENKQKSTNYVIPRRNEEKFEKKVF